MDFGSFSEKVSRFLTEKPGQFTDSVLTTLQQRLSKQELPSGLKENLYLKAFGFLKVPALFFCSPSVLEVGEEKCVIRIPLNGRTKNHLGGMYFGVLCIGADVAGGLNAMRMIGEEGVPVSLIFKDLQAQFLKRVEGDALFTCNDGKVIREAVKKAIETGERQSFPVHVTATVPSHFGEEPVAQFALTLSLKRKALS